MKNTKKRGFTLIELLAVIVILAIIALIATPIILNMITKARKNAARSSALGYIDAIEYNNGFASIGTEGYTAIESGSVTGINVKLKGKKPTSGTITVDKDGKVTKAENLCINGYIVNYDGQDATVGNKCNGSSTPAQTNTAYQVGDAINYDPTTNKLCTTPTSTTGTKTGCMKWYVIKASGTNDDKVDVILDHNTTAKVAYNTTTPYVPYAQASIKATVDNDTTGWASGLNPRLITAQEVADITNTTTFDGSSSKWFYFDGTGDNKQTQASSSQGDNEYAWLFDYTKGCESYGCNTADSSNYGYWTSSPVSDFSNGAWYVRHNGSLNYCYVDYVGYYGVRPVITIDKSALQ